MLNKVLKVLKDQNIATYRINDVTVESTELFFVKKSLDTRRVENYRTVNVTVFRPFEKNGIECLGNADVSIEPSMSEEVIADRIGSAWSSAAFVSNRPFSQADKNVEEITVVPSTLADVSMNEAAEKVTEALFRNDTDSNTFINSAEIFITKKTKHILNSNGLDVGFIKYTLSGEYVCQCRTPEDVETYATIGAYDGLECDQLAEKVKKTLQMTKDRAVAKPNRVSGKADIVLSDDYAITVLGYYTKITNAAYTYMQYFDKEAGDFIQGSREETTGDLITQNYIPNAPYSDEGIKMEIISGTENGILKNLWGGLRYPQYLGLKPTGDEIKTVMKTGSMSFEDMKKQPGLYVVNFSDFQMDIVTGHFRGEIRLAYFNDGSSTVPVTGGSVNGDISESEKTLRLSSEKQTTESFEGPLAVLLRNVSVAGT